MAGQAEYVKTGLPKMAALGVSLNSEGDVGGEVAAKALDAMSNVDREVSMSTSQYTQLGFQGMSEFTHTQSV